MSEENTTTDAVNGTEQTQPETMEEVKKPSKRRAPRKKLSETELAQENAKVTELIENEKSDTVDEQMTGIVDRRSVASVPEAPNRKRKPVDRNAYRRIKKFNGRVNL